jgi:hypothetical protein
MSISFRAFAQVKSLAFPVKTFEIASSLGFHPPVSLRAVIGTAGPFQPIFISYTPSAEGATDFIWYDEANLPGWVWEADDSPYGPPDKIRQATSFEFKLWQAPGGDLIADQKIPYNVASGSGLPAGYDAGVLAGSYTYQITAFNSFGASSTVKEGPINITPPEPGPNIHVTVIGANDFQIHGTGFEAWSNQTLDVNVDLGIGTTAIASQEPVPTVRVDGQGEFDTNVTATVCGSRSGAQLRFSISQQNAVGSISNYFFETCR